MWFCFCFFLIHPEASREGSEIREQQLNLPRPVVFRTSLHHVPHFYVHIYAKQYLPECLNWEHNEMTSFLMFCIEGRKISSLIAESSISCDWLQNESQSQNMRLQQRARRSVWHWHVSVVVDTLTHLRGAVVRAKSKRSRACAAAVSAGRHVNGAPFGVTKKKLKTPVAGTVIQGPQSGWRAAYWGPLL